MRWFMSLTQNIQRKPPLSKDRIDKAKQDFHHTKIDTIASKSFLHSFVNAIASIQQWDHLVGTVILNSSREDLLDYLGEHYDKETKKSFWYNKCNFLK